MTCFIHNETAITFVWKNVKSARGYLIFPPWEKIFSPKVRPSGSKRLSVSRGLPALRTLVEKIDRCISENIRNNQSVRRLGKHVLLKNVTTRLKLPAVNLIGKTNNTYLLRCPVHCWTSKMWETREHITSMKNEKYHSQNQEQSLNPTSSTKSLFYAWRSMFWTSCRYVYQFTKMKILSPAEPRVLAVLVLVQKQSSWHLWCLIRARLDTWFVIPRASAEGSKIRCMPSDPELRSLFLARFAKHTFAAICNFATG